MMKRDAFKSFSFLDRTRNAPTHHTMTTPDPFWILQTHPQTFDKKTIHQHIKRVKTFDMSD